MRWLSIISPRRGSVGVVFDGGRRQLAAVLGAASGRHGAHITDTMNVIITFMVTYQKKCNSNVTGNIEFLLLN